jgi:YVTN family beta-propeller protein
VTTRGWRSRAALALLVVALAACSEGSSAQPAGERSPTPASSATPAAHGIHVVDRLSVGGQPCGVAAVAGAVWVSDAQRARLLRIDPTTGAVRKAARLDRTPCEIAVGYGSLWVVTQSGRLDRVDPRSGEVVARIAVGDTSYEAVAGLGSIWVSNRNDGTVDRVDPGTNRVVSTLHLGGSPGGLVFADGALWVGDDTTGSSRFFHVDPHTGHVSRVRSGNRPGYVATSGGSIWVSNVDDGTVTQVDPQTSKPLRTVEVGLSPVNLVGTTGTSREIWVPDDVGNQVVRLDARTGRVLGRLPAEGGPAVTAPAGRDVWVTLFEGGAVLRMQAA